MELISRRIALQFATVATLVALNACAGLSEPRPRVEIRVGTQDLTTAAVISSVRVEDHLDGADRFTIVISNGFDPVSRELRFLEVLQAGQPVKIRMGNRERNGRQLTVEGTIDSIGTAFLAEGSAERRVGKECRSRWSPYH